MNRRIQQILEMESLTQAQFAERIDVGRASISHILNGRNKPGYDIIQSILKQFPRINPDWLILGKGKPYREPEQPTLPPDQGIFTGKMNSGDIAESRDFIDNELFMRDENDIFPAENPINDDANKSYNGIDEPKKPKTERRRIKRITIYYDDNTFEEFFR